MTSVPELYRLFQNRKQRVHDVDVKPTGIVTPTDSASGIVHEKDGNGMYDVIYVPPLLGTMRRFFKKDTLPYIRKRAKKT